MPQLFTPTEAAKKLRVDRLTIYRWIESGHLQANRFPDGRLRIEPKELDNLLTGIRK